METNLESGAGPEFRLAHVGINASSEQEAAAVAELFGKAFSFPVRRGASSVFAGDGVEVMKTPCRGRNGHIAVGTDDLPKAVEWLRERGFEMDESTAKYQNGAMTAVYLKQEFGGFGVHLLQKTP